MLLPLFYYLVAVFIFVLLYEYYRNHIRKQKANLDFLESLEQLQLNSLFISNKKSFHQIKTEICSVFNFNRIRIIFGIDFSASNEWQGRRTFNGQSLHKTNVNKIYNPYQKAISQIGVLFEEIFASKIEYSCFGFGDEHTKDFSFFPIVGSGEEFINHQRILDAYLEQTKNIVLSGPTAFTPMIKNLISYGIHCSRDFTMLIILTDEPKFSHEDSSFVESIRMLTHLPNTCLIIIGVGDGPWQKMSYEEHRLRELVFKNKVNKKKNDKFQEQITPTKLSYDNFHFINYNSMMARSEKNANENFLARAVLTKLPTQLKQVFNNEQQNIAQF